ncbi:MAG: hypothetical protein ACYCX6_09700 [Vulcanimicrobiaceae bacterium]
MDKWDNDAKFAAWVASGILALIAVEKFFKHPTFGNGLKGFVAMVGFAVS